MRYRVFRADFFSDPSTYRLAQLDRASVFNAIVNLRTLLSPSQDLGTIEHADLPRNVSLCRPHRIYDFADGPFAVANSMQDLQPGRLAQQGEIARYFFEELNHLLAIKIIIHAGLFKKVIDASI